MDAEDRPARRYHPPLLALDQRRRLAFDRHQLDLCLKQRGDVGKTTQKLPWLTGRSTPGFREDDKAVALRHRQSTLGDQCLGVEVVADIAGSANEATEIGIAPQLLLDHALRPRHQRHEEYYIQQRGMIGHD